jgi:crossover junction endodeoxyribonuclease RuvC
MTGRLFAGIDCGLSGALALVRADGSMLSVEDMPLIESGGGTVRREVNAVELARLLRVPAPSIAFALVEKVGAMPKQGLSSTFSLGRSLGVAEAVIATLGIPHAVIPAAKWKRLAGLGADKGAVRAAASRRWPEAPLARVRDHGRAEALFLALLAAQHALGGFDAWALASDRRVGGNTLRADACNSAGGDPA